MRGKFTSGKPFYVGESRPEVHAPRGWRFDRIGILVVVILFWAALIAWVRWLIP